MTQGELFPAALVTQADPVSAAGEWWEAIVEADFARSRSAVARLAPCRRCSALVLSAADRTLDECADSVVDARLLDRGLEVAALLAGRYTCELEVSAHGGGPRLFRRDAWLAPREPWERRRLWVPAHVCHEPIGFELPLQVIYPAEYQQFTRSQNVSNVPPF